ncbi:interleukin-20 receptor subunit alpha-like [Heterodontus francisci]|uniref:interleukin-20 receptor subunit alpha-like n=1 Tax=Heterodontus francisci TaxID=7792 RepID=UPI00355BC0C1
MPTTVLLPITLLILSEVTGIPWGCTLSAPSNVRFLSINLQNTVHWELARGKECRIQSSVQYKIYGEKDWKNKKECQNITRTQCDLSNETADYEEYYYARVKAVSGAGFSDWTKSERFNPKVETNISSPKVKVEAGVCAISITLTPPKKWKNSNEARAISLAKVFLDLKYKLSIINRKTNKSLIFLEDGKFKKVDTLDHDTTYCVTARSVEFSFYRRSEPSESVCATTPKDPTKQMVKMILLGCVLPVFLFFFLFALVGCFMYKYVYVSDQKQPVNLLLQYRPKTTFIFIPPEPLKVNIMVLENDGSKALSHGCLDVDNCETPLTSQVSSKSANKWNVIPLPIESDKIADKSQTVKNPTTEKCASSRESDVQTTGQAQQNDYRVQSHLPNRKKTQNEAQYEVIAIENISHRLLQQNIQLPSEECMEPLQVGYRSQLPTWPLIREAVQHNVEYSFIGADTSHNPQNEQAHHTPNGGVDKPQETDYIPRPLANGMNTQTIGSDTVCSRVVSYRTIDPQHESIYLPKVPLELEQSNYRSQFQPQPLTGKAPLDGVDRYAAVMGSNFHILNEKHHEEVEEPGTTIIDWDINTGRLTIPTVMVNADSENSGSLTQSLEPGIALLSSLYTKDLPDEFLRTEEDTYLSQFQKHWRLHVET